MTWEQVMKEWVINGRSSFMPWVEREGGNERGKEKGLGNSLSPEAAVIWEKDDLFSLAVPVSPWSTTSLISWRR